MGLEPMTPTLKVWCSTNWATKSIVQRTLLREKDSNQRPSAYEADELPLLYPTIYFRNKWVFEPIFTLYPRTALSIMLLVSFVEMSGFEPKLQQSKCCVLTNYTTSHFYLSSWRLIIVCKSSQPLKNFVYIRYGFVQIWLSISCSHKFILFSRLVILNITKKLFLMCFNRKTSNPMNVSLIWNLYTWLPQTYLWSINGLSNVAVCPS